MLDPWERTRANALGEQQGGKGGGAQIRVSWLDGAGATPPPWSSFYSPGGVPLWWALMGLTLGAMVGLLRAPTLGAPSSRPDEAH